MIEPNKAKLSIKRQCELVSLVKDISMIPVPSNTKI